MQELRPGADDLGRRLDRVARHLLPALPLSRLFQAIRTGEILVSRQGSDRRAVEGGYRLREGDIILIGGRLLDSLRPGTRKASDRDVPTTEASASRGDPGWLKQAIILETEKLLVLNKPRGLVVHGERSVEQAVRAYLAPRIPDSLSFVPGPLHRLDRNTTGLLVFGRSLEGARLFTALLRSGRVTKGYLALLEGRLTDEARWEDRLQRDRRTRITGEGREGRVARTQVRPLVGDSRYTLAAVRIETGLTHQIRAQAALHGHPLAGDRKYGAAPFPGGYLLHAWILELGAEGGPLGMERVVAPPPPSSVAALQRLFGREPIDRLLALRLGARRGEG